MLKIENLHVSYGKIAALKGISLEVNEGEIITLIGANGAGKSTTMNAIMGLAHVQKGTITYLGKNITNQDARHSVKSGIVLAPEGRQVFPELSVYDNLLLGGYTKTSEEHEEQLKIIYELFPRLLERVNQMAGTLSGGEQQMLTVGRALMGKPKLLLLDEPSLGLAPMLVNEIFQLIKRIRDMGTTILLVEQNANVALRISDRAYVLETGVVGLEGDAQELLASDEVRKAYLGGL
ncbi:MAG: ABC transporter ATP-binding protein [Christensenellales bacterium]|jgi:branched-chain amino acid transport system ATP-binding protein